MLYHDPCQLKLKACRHMRWWYKKTSIVYALYLYHAVTILVSFPVYITVMNANIHCANKAPDCYFVQPQFGYTEMEWSKRCKFNVNLWTLCFLSCKHDWQNCSIQTNVYISNDHDGSTWCSCRGRVGRKSTGYELSLSWITSLRKIKLFLMCWKFCCNGSVMDSRAGVEI